MQHVNHGSRFNHAEAFCLMWYQDLVTGERERLWNGRDGVTPFVITSPAGNESRHADFHLDERRPMHVPKIGDRIFVDLTIERAREYRRVFVDKWWDVEIEGGYRMRDRTDVWQTKDEAVESLAQGDYAPLGGNAGGQPDIVIVDADYLVQFGNRLTTGRTTAEQVAALQEQLRAAANTDQPNRKQRRAKKLRPGVCPHCNGSGKA